MEQKTEKKKLRFGKLGELRKLDKPIYIFLFPLLFCGLYLGFRQYCENYYQTEWPVWTLFLIFPLMLLGIAAGYQLQIYLKKTLGTKGEMLLDLLLSAVFVWALFAEYQYVLAPQAGLPPLTWGMLGEALKRHFMFWKE